MNKPLEASDGLTATSPGAAHAHKAGAVWLLAYLLVFLMLDFTWLAWLLPQSTGDPADRLPWSRLMVLVCLAGSMGGTLHGLASLSVHVGRRTFDRRWSLFYVARPFVGAGLSVFTWLVLSSGIGGISVAGDLALLAWAALAGLYSQPALDKLRDLFATLFKTDPKPGSSAVPTKDGAHGHRSGAPDATARSRT